MIQSNVNLARTPWFTVAPASARRYLSLEKERPDGALETGGELIASHRASELVASAGARRRAALRLERNAE